MCTGGVLRVKDSSDPAQLHSKDMSMIIAINLALLPVGFVAVMAARELRPWWRQLQQIRALPESIRPETIRRESPL